MGVVGDLGLVVFLLLAFIVLSVWATYVMSDRVGNTQAESFSGILIVLVIISMLSYSVFFIIIYPVLALEIGIIVWLSLRKKKAATWESETDRLKRKLKESKAKLKEVEIASEAKLKELERGYEAKLKELKAKFEQKEEEIREFKEELSRTKEEKRRLELERALKKKKAEMIDVVKERKWQLNGLLKILKRRYNAGEISTKGYKQTKERYERELKKLENG